tara:strand:+ start:571 stop:1191 length:621 start_codon:yes stop_codon:yes gene_type:complete
LSKNKYIRNDFFVTPIFKFKNENLAKKLNEFILEKDINGIESNTANELKHNLSESNFNFFSAKDTIINESKNFIALCLKDVLNDIQNEDCDYKISFNESWYHIGSKNSTHNVHMHANCSWCGIFYLQTDQINNGGSTVFNSPIKTNYYDFGSFHLSETDVSIIPEDGLLVFFPSYLQHYQDLYRGDKDRIVVGFNCRVLEKVNIDT